MSHDFPLKNLNIEFCPRRRMENGLNVTFSGSAGRSSGAGLGCLCKVHGETQQELPTCTGYRFQPFLLSSVEQEVNKTLDLKRKKMKGISDLFVMPKAIALHVEG